MMGTKRFLRYLAPNLVTLASLTFGLLSIWSSFEGRPVDAAWFIVWSVLTDKLDGFTARLLKAASEFGVQLDSFADFLNFGIAPATLWYTFLTRVPGLPFAAGRGHALLVVSCFLWVLAVTFRLARYNVVGDDPRCRRIFFGVPTTLMGGVLVSFFLTCLKYGEPSLQALGQGTGAAAFGGPRLFGDETVGLGAWRAMPALILVGAYLMASTVKIPKLGLTKSRALSVFILANVLFGYAAGFGRVLPEYLTVLPMLWIIGSILWGMFSMDARALRPPPLFPKEDRPASRMPQRPEEDALPDDDDSAARVTDPAASCAGEPASVEVARSVR